MNKIFDVFDLLIESFCKVLLAGDVILVSYIVLARYVFRYTPAWGDQLALVLMVWIALLTATIGVRYDTHIKVTLIEGILSPKVLKILDGIIEILMVIFAIFMIIEGSKLTQLSSHNIITGLNIKSSWLYVSIPFCGLIMLIQLLRKVRLFNNDK